MAYNPLQMTEKLGNNKVRWACGCIDEVHFSVYENMRDLMQLADLHADKCSELKSMVSTYYDKEEPERLDER